MSEMKKAHPPVETAPPKSSAPTSGHSDHGSQASFLVRLRRVPRWVWLAMSATLLFVATTVWISRVGSLDAALVTTTQQRTPGSSWWTEVPVRRADATLPEISGRAFGVAVQKPSKGTPERVWIVGTTGLLAYTENEGRCWTKYEYNSKKGEFLPPATNPCPIESKPGLPLGPTSMRWPTVVPTVYAAFDQPPSSSPKKKPLNSSSQSSSPVQQQAPAGNAAQQKSSQAPAPSGSQSNAPANLQSTPAKTTNSQQKTDDSSTTGGSQSNTSPSQQSVPASGNVGQKPGENPATSGPQQNASPSQQTLGPSGKVPPSPGGNVTPDAAGKPATSAKSKRPVTGATQPKVGDVSPAVAVLPPPNPPSEAPDLLAIQFGMHRDDAAGVIVSTGGMEWRLERDNAGRDIWTGQVMGDGQTDQIGGTGWRFSTPKKSGYAAETYSLDDIPYGRLEGPSICTDCLAIKPGTSEDWSVGWSTDDTGDNAAVFRSIDGGKSWLPVTRGALPRERRAAATAGHPWRWMPRWYLVMLLLSLALAAPALLPPPNVIPDGPEPETSNVEGRLSSDKPLSPGEFDALGVTSIALGLSSFLRNKKTLPPLTIGINGEWGSGKSSLMNLLRCDLESYGMYPVWFNAWHHQKEEHLLAALLQTVRAEAVPPLRNLLGVPFRARLLWYHFRRRWPLLVAIAAALIFLIALDYRVRVGPEKSDLFVWLANQIVPSLGAKPSNVPWIPVQGSLIALLTAVGVLWKGLTAFGANPASLLASVAQGNKIKDLEEQPASGKNSRWNSAILRMLWVHDANLRSSSTTSIGACRGMCAMYWRP